MRRAAVLRYVEIFFAIVLAIWLGGAVAHAQANLRGRAEAMAPLPRISERALRETGIRRIEGRHLTLYTDLPADGPVGQEIDSLPGLFDLAVAEWANYFGVDAKRTADWHVRGFLIKDREKFRSAGLIPETIAKFQNGFSTARQLWVMDQASDYYRRHLLLHEGTHAFMYSMLGGCGPGWHMEGLAEMLGTHKLAQGRLQLGYLPENRSEVPLLGRIKLVQDETRAGRFQPIARVLKIDNRKHLANTSYAWSWALVKFLDAHPRYQQRFRALKKQSRDNRLSQKFLARVREDWTQLEDEWRLFAGELIHGYDIERAAVTFQPGEPLGAKPGAAGSEGTESIGSEPVLFSLKTDRGWQSTGVRLEKGQTIHLDAEGRFEIARTEKVWWCEANGVTIRYHAGEPLGLLQAAIRPAEREQAGRLKTTTKKSNAASTDWIVRPIPVGLGKSLTAEYAGTLYLRVNDSPAELGDNVGELRVTIRSE